MSLRDAPTMPIARTLGAVFLAIAIVVVVASQHGAFVSITSLVTDPVRPDASLGIAGSYAARRTVPTGEKKTDGGTGSWAKLFAGIQTPFRALRTRSHLPRGERTVRLPSYNLGRRDDDNS